MRQKTVFRTPWQNALTLGFAFFFLSNAVAQTAQVKKGASSVELQCSSPAQGIFYYALYNTAQSGLTAVQLKTDAQSAQTTTIVRNGKVGIGSTLTGTSLTKLITNLTDTTNYYLYTFFESLGGSAGTVQSFPLLLSKRQQVKSYTINSKTNLYTLYRPEAYLKDQSNRTFPLIIACHGDGQTGTNNLAKFLTDGMPEAIEELNDYDFVIAAPQINKDPGQDWTSASFMDAFLELIKANNRIDLNRVYITGLSGGGGGVYTLASAQPGKIAAVIPLAGGLPSSTYFLPCAMKDVPLYGIHNSGDPTIQVTNLYSAINAINACSPAPIKAPITTIYSSNQHDAWYNDFRAKTIYQWLLKNVKNNPLNQAPTISVSTPVSVNATSTTATTLTVSATDPDGNSALLTYEWYKIKGPDVTVYNQNTATLNVSDLKAGTYVFRVIVKDAAGVSSFEDITLEATGTANQLPTITLPANGLVSLPANSSFALSPVSVYDADGVVLSYGWSIVSGPSGHTSQITNTKLKSTEITQLKLGTYTLRFAATDDRGGYSQQTMQLVVNYLPQVNAGEDQDLLLPATATLNGIASDPDGSIASVKWTGPAGVTIQNSTSNQATVAGLAAGVYEFTFEATDNVGTKSQDKVSVYIASSSSIAPSLTITSPTAGSTITSTVNVAASTDASGIKEVQFYFNNKTSVDAYSPYSFTDYGVANGTYTATVYAVSTSGKRTKGTVTFNVGSASNPAPTVALIVPTASSSFLTQSLVNLAVTTADANGQIASVTYFANNVQIASSTVAPFSAVWTPTASGTYTIKATAVDNQGASTTSTVNTITVTANTNQAPSVSLNAPVNNSSYVSLSTVALSATATDADGTVASVKFYASGNLVGTASSSPYTVSWTPATPNVYTITAVATDNVGGTTTSSPVSVTITNQLPTVSISAPANNAAVSLGSAVNMTASATDVDGNISSVAFYVNSTLLGTSSLSPYTYAWTPSTAGTYSLTAVATDNKSGTTTSSAVSVVVSASSNQSPTLQITAPTANQNFAVNTNVTATATASDADGQVTGVTFYNNGILLGTDNYSPFTYTIYTAQLSASNTLTATATDNNGATTTATVLFTVGNNGNNLPPTVQITTPTANQNFAVGSNITVNATASDPDGTISQVQFYIGSNVNVDQWAPYSFTVYTVPAGTYLVRAIAKDNSNATTETSFNITVGGSSPRMDFSTENSETNVASTQSTVFPNPTTGSVEISAWQEGDTYEVYNATGSLLLQGRSSIVSLENMPSGLYILKHADKLYKVVKK